MRTLWTGTLGFGLVNIPVNLYSGTQDHNLDLDMLHKTDLEPIRYAKVCTGEGEEVTKDEIVKGYEYEDGKYVVLTKEDFQSADVKQTKLLEILAFTDQSTVNPIYFEKFYYLEPGKGGEKAYALLRDALTKTGKAGMIQFVMRDRGHIGMVLPYGDMLILLQMRFAEEIREPEGLSIPKENAGKKEVDLALHLIESLTGDFNPEDYHDTYAEKLQQLVEDKLKGKKPSAKSPRKENTKPSNVRSLMALLEASIDRKTDKKQSPNSKNTVQPSKKSKSASSAPKSGRPKKAS